MTKFPILTQKFKTVMEETFSSIKGGFPALLGRGHLCEYDVNDVTLLFDVIVKPNGFRLTISNSRGEYGVVPFFFILDGTELEFGTDVNDIVKISDYFDMCGNEELYFQRSTLEELPTQSDLELIGFYHHWLMGEYDEIASDT